MDTKDKSKKCILIVDDIKMNREIIKLSIHGNYTFFEAENGIEALEVLQKNTVDLLITDIVMSKMDGYTLITEVRKNSKYKDMPIIAITEKKAVLRQRVMELGANDFICKPFINEMIGIQVEKVLNHEHISTIKELYKKVFDKNPITFILFRLIKDSSGKYNGYRIEYINGVTQSISGCIDEHFEGREFYDSVPKFKEFLIQTNLNQVECHEVFYDTRLEKYFEVTAYQESEGYVACMLTDITEHENNILRQKIEMENIVNAIPGGVALYKVGDKVETLYFSDGVPALSGYTVDEYKQIIKQDAMDLFYQGDREVIEEAIEKCINKHEEVDVVFRKNHISGSLVWVKVHVRQIGVQEGCPLLHAVFHNITEEAQLQESVLESSDAVIFVMDEDTKELIYANGAAREYASTHGWMYEGLPCYEFFKGRNRECDNCYLSYQSVLENESNHIEWKDTNANRYFNIHTKKMEWFGRNIRIHFLRDINELKQTFSELQQSQNRLNHAIEGAGFAVWEYDLDTHCILQGNKEFEEFGYSSVIENVPWSIVESGAIAPESIDDYMDIYNRLFAGECEVSGEFWCHNNNSVEFRCFRLFYSVEEDVGIGRKAYALSQDITLSKLNSKRYEKTMNAMLSSNPYALQTYHLNLTQNKIKTVEESVLNTDICTVDDFVRVACKYINEEKIEEFKEVFSRDHLLHLFHQAERYVSCKHFMLEGGDTIYAETSINMVEHPISGDVEAILRVRDITQQVLEEKITQQITNETCDFIALIDIKQQMIEYRHKNSKQVQKLVAGKHPLDVELVNGIRVIATDEEREVCRQKMQISTIMQELEKNKAYEVEYTRKLNDEIPSRKVHRYTYLDESKRYILLVCSDITESYNLQREQIAKIQEALDKAEQATKAKTDFLSNMSHDMRTPMNAILGLTNLAMDSDNLEEIKDYLLKVNESGKYLLSLINDTLDVSRIENGKLELKPELINSNHLLDAVIASIKVTAEQKEIEFVVLKNNFMDVMLYVDAVKVSKIFVNLLSNAVKFTPRGGRVEFILENVKRENGYSLMEIHVKDTGIGMEQDFIPHIFEPFRQESTEVSSNYTGTGLGMTIVKSLLDLMGGSIEICSERGKGTDIKILLGFRHATSFQTAQADKVMVKVQNGNNKRILLVEDHPLNREIARKLLEREKYQVECACNGKEATEMFHKAAENYYSLILMDIRMPIMNGIEATKIIRQMNRMDAKSIPILAMTANAYESDRNATKEAGMNAHLSKPVEPQKLYAVLKEYI